MEVSKSLQVDIKNIQNQLKTAIRNHQTVVLKLRDDPSNTQMQKQLLGMQKHIILLGESQKRLVQQLRKELEANSTNSTLSVKSVALSLGINSNVKSQEKNSCIPVRPSSVSSSSSTTSEDLEDSQKECDDDVAKCCSGKGGDPSLATKLQFMNAVGLVTREVLSELQNRRVERKRRSTANHTQFVYGSFWDLSKRKKSTYLTAGIPPLTRQLTRTLRAESHHEEKSPLSSVQGSNVGSHQRTVSPQTTIPSTTASLALRIPGLPASLTIERIQPNVCVICRKSGVLEVCSNCSAEHHISCAADGGLCPQCSIKKDGSNSYLQEREAEKQRLLRRNTELKLEKDTLEKRAAELSDAVMAQTESRKEMLQSEESTRKSIQCIHDFVTIIKSGHSPQPPS